MSLTELCDKLTAGVALAIVRVDLCACPSVGTRRPCALDPRPTELDCHCVTLTINVYTGALHACINQRVPIHLSSNAILQVRLVCLADALLGLKCEVLDAACGPCRGLLFAVKRVLGSCNGLREFKQALDRLLAALLKCGLRLLKV